MRNLTLSVTVKLHCLPACSNCSAWEADSHISPSSAEAKYPLLHSQNPPLNAILGLFTPQPPAILICGQL